VPIDWHFPDSASPAEKRDHILKEVQFVAAQLKPRVLDLDKVDQGIEANGGLENHKDWLTVYACLLSLLADLVANVAWTNGTDHSIRYWPSVLNPDANPEHTPLETLGYLRLLREECIKSLDQGVMQDKWYMLTAMDKLIRQSEDHADQAKQERTVGEEANNRLDETFPA
jgi:hypothetical protein